MYYNFGAVSFLSKKLCTFVADCIQLKLSFIPKKEKVTVTVTVFEPPFGTLRGNVRTSSIARWKARVRLPIRRN